MIIAVLFNSNQSMILWFCETQKKKSELLHGKGWNSSHKWGTWCRSSPFLSISSAHNAWLIPDTTLLFFDSWWWQARMRWTSFYSWTSLYMKDPPWAIHQVGWRRKQINEPNVGTAHSPPSSGKPQLSEPKSLQGSSCRVSSETPQLLHIQPLSLPQLS